LKVSSQSARWAIALVALTAVAVTVAVTASARTGKSHATFIIGVSNTLVGNGWREEMICAVKAQAAASGVVSKVIIANRNGGPAELGGKGNVVEMRGIAGVPADTDRHTGFNQALKKYPGIKVVKSTFMGWNFATAGKQMLDILNSGVKVDGVWNSGADYTVITAFKTAGKPLVPIVGADNNEFLHQMLVQYPKLQAAAVTNPAVIGGAGAAVAIKLLQGQKVKTWVKLTPLVWSMPGSKAQIKANYSSKRAPTYSARLQIKPWTTYTTAQLTACKGP
jgi:ribose transport system substrate-binding protein